MKWFKKSLFAYIVTTTSCMASQIVIPGNGIGATPVCPFTVAGGPKVSTRFTVNVYSGPACAATTSIGNHQWQASSVPLTNGVYSLSNEALILALGACSSVGPVVSLSVAELGPSGGRSMLCMTASCNGPGFVNYNCTSTGTLILAS